MTNNSRCQKRKIIKELSLLLSYRIFNESASSLPLKDYCDLRKYLFTELDLLERRPLSLDEAHTAVITDLVVVQVDHLQFLPLFLTQPN